MTPIGVLKLDGVTSVLYFSLRIVPRMNLTLVFPQEPVMPIRIRSFRSRRIRCASRKYISLIAFSIGQAIRPASATHTGRNRGNSISRTAAASAGGVQKRKAIRIPAKTTNETTYSRFIRGVNRNGFLAF